MIFKAANRYAFSKQHRQRRLSILIILGIAAGMAALIIIIGIMNSLQDSQLSRIRDVESFDVTLTDTILTPDEIMKFDGVELAFEYLDIPAMAGNIDTGSTSFVKLRGISKALLDHPRFYLSVRIPGELDDTFYLGNRLAVLLDSFAGYDVRITFLKNGNTVRLIPFSMNIPTMRTFSSSSAEFSETTIITSIDNLRNISSNSETKLGIYVSDSNRLNEVVRQIKEADPDSAPVTWKEANSALYSALLLEKYMVVFFLAFIIIIVSYYLKRSTRRMIASKRKEAAAMRAMGMTRRGISMVFLVQAMEISLIGLLLGIGLGLIVASQLTPILKFINGVVKFITGNSTILASYPFSVHIQTNEILFFSLMIMVCTCLFSLAGARDAFKIDIMEILKNDSQN